ncbi:hypothetical protein GHT06_022659 [Daphnia sinensis]|uniref:Endoplasmic reticulum-Golgi intermediate compartment protein 3 n=1 Tax=Daphnia sinensis TaxID=1820382 RepID=A0AAD5KXI5_9CRUS|nr:hypothetical protein GHT06_022659 [Daphnia sinensis]
MMKNLGSAFKTIDAYPKTLEDFTIKTATGAIVTVFSSLIMVFLFVIEFQDFLSVSVLEQLYVDTTRIPNMKINFDVTFPKISCSYLSVDAVDSSGEQQLGVEHNIFKQRLSLSGEALQAAELESINKSHNQTQTTTEDTAIKPCNSCYGAKEGCCDTCAEVREAYRQKNWAFRPDEFEQCRNEKNLTRDDSVFKEGCQIYGYLEVNRVSGSFHIAPGKSYAINHVHVHDVQPYSSEDFNVTHYINSLSFGSSLMGKANPLDGFITAADKGAMMFQYYIKVVPTWYVKLDGEEFHTNQYSVTRHQKVVSSFGGENGVPGVFFTYEMSPLQISYKESKRSIGHFVTDVCTIIGGVFTVAGIIDSLLYRSSKILQQKLQLGKAT